MAIKSIFVVTDYKTGKKQEVAVSGAGQEAVKTVRRSYPRKEYPYGVKIVLEGFEINHEFKEVDLS